MLSSQTHDTLIFAGILLIRIHTEKRKNIGFSLLKITSYISRSIFGRKITVKLPDTNTTISKTLYDTRLYFPHQKCSFLRKTFESNTC